MQLQKDQEKFQQAGLVVVGVSYDSVDVLKKFSESRKITFTLLSDQGSQTIKKYGIHFMRGLPHPGTFVIDQQGVVRAKLFEEGYRRRHSHDALIQAAAELSPSK